MSRHEWLRRWNHVQIGVNLCISKKFYSLSPSPSGYAVLSKPIVKGTIDNKAVTQPFQ